MELACVQKFKQTYLRDPDGIAFCPYRLCPLGAHVDHQYGLINGFAINYGIHIAYSAKHNGVVELASLNFPKRAQFHVASVDEEPVGDWADHLRGATKILGELYSLRVGLCGVIEGSLPVGGLSSSAAVIISFLAALCKVNNIELDEMEMVRLAKRAENEYVGVACGKLDQDCEVLCKKDHLLYLDTQDDSYELIPKHPDMKPFKFAVLFSGLERSLVSSGYNMRQDECKAAAYAMEAFSNRKYGTFDETRLRDVPQEVFDEYQDKLPESWRKRAQHYYEETARAKAGAEAWRRGDLDTYGKLVFESGYSSIYNYECGCPEMKTLYEIMRETDGVYGGRFSGAGFKGCCMALIDPEKAESIEKNIEEKYLAAYPHLRGKYSFHVCESADGVGIRMNLR